MVQEMYVRENHKRNDLMVHEWQLQKNPFGSIVEHWKQSTLFTIIRCSIAQTVWQKEKHMRGQQNEEVCLIHLFMCITLRVIICASKSPTKNPNMDENDFVRTGLILKLLLYFRQMGDSETIVAITCKYCMAFRTIAGISVLPLLDSIWVIIGEVSSPFITSLFLSTVLSSSVVDHKRPNCLSLWFHVVDVIDRCCKMIGDLIRIIWLIGGGMYAYNLWQKVTKMTNNTTRRPWGE